VVLARELFIFFTRKWEGTFTAILAAVGALVSVEKENVSR
jgi:hypothetical protein